jgi:hypothetical protein
MIRVRETGAHIDQISAAETKTSLKEGKKRQRRYFYPSNLRSDLVQHQMRRLAGNSEQLFTGVDGPRKVLISTGNSLENSWEPGSRATDPDI